MKNPNQDTSEDVLRRLKETSYERMRNELKCSIELKIKDFDMTWDDLARLLGLKERPIEETDWELSRADKIKENILWGKISLRELNAITHIFSCEPYIIFRPREPWTQT